MKKSFFSIAYVMFFVVVGNAQKLYSTKTAQVKFNASGGAVPIAAQNDQGDSKMVDKTGQLVFSVLIKGFKFENQLMEDHFNENYLESSKFPKAEFRGTIKNIAAVNFTKDGSYEVEADGELNLHGVKKPIAVPGKLTITGGKVVVKSDFKIKIKDYGITGLYIGDKIAAEASISINAKYE